jgi:hypothetical protein
MFTQGLTVEVVVAMVLGAVTLSAAGYYLLRETRKAFDRGVGTWSIHWLIRPVTILFLSLAGSTLVYAYATGRLERYGVQAPHFDWTPDWTPPWARAAQESDSEEPTADRAQADGATTASLKASGKLEDWLQSEGSKLYYRYSLYLPDACPGNPIAIGNWAQGEAKPVAATCIDKEWLVLDFGPLIADGRIVPDVTYCLNFRSASRAWGLQVPEQAPGLDSVAVPAIRVPLGRAIGVRYLKGLRERIVPSSASPRADC